MQVEECCSALLDRILPVIDKEREGWAIDIGVGTFCFYCQRFECLGFRTAAVEPLAVEELRTLCSNSKIQLIETCIADKNGTATLYKGTFQEEENLNLNSLRSDWWGIGKDPVEVPTMTLQSLVQKLSAEKITCIKLDVEGLEFSVIKQIAQLNDKQIPRLIMFEYGGGGTRESRKGGWSGDIFGETLASLKILSNLGFDKTILVDSSATEPRIQSLQGQKEFETYFGSEFIYGNIITSRHAIISDEQIISCCLPFAENKPSSIRDENFTIRMKLSKIVKQILGS
jgi:FkbM family methyltransferase